MASRRVVFCGLALVLGLSVPAAAQLRDYKGYTDPELFTRMPHYVLAYLTSFEERQFDAVEFCVMEGGRPAKRRVEGRHRKYVYTFDKSSGAAPASYLQIVRNYQNAAAAYGGDTLCETQTWTTIRLAPEGRETWVELRRRGADSYVLVILDRGGMAQDVVASAESLPSGLVQHGRVEVPGIFFDFGEAEVKPESDAALAEVAKLVKASSPLALWVVGHTDSVGTAAANVKLSTERAAAVVRVLTGRFGVDAKRLVPHGAGPYAPVATNSTEAGRAKNRRVELVAQGS
jgi:OmpA-OmpF porin, OOP family